MLGGDWRQIGPNRGNLPSVRLSVVQDRIRVLEAATDSAAIGFRYAKLACFGQQFNDVPAPFRRKRRRRWGD
jgi:hypothetical protein